MQVNSDLKSFEMPSSMLVSAIYDNKKKSATLKFYEPVSQKIILWSDETNHKPYCYSKLLPKELSMLDEREDVVSVELVKRYDLLEFKDCQVSKITTTNPLAIGGTDGSIRNLIDTWESDIKYYENYLYDRQLIVGKYYKISKGQLAAVDTEISTVVKKELENLLWSDKDDTMINQKEFNEYISEWANLLNLPIPNIKRLSFDIEVESTTGRLPDAKLSQQVITAIGFRGSDDLKKVFVLRHGDKKDGENKAKGVDVIFYDDESSMLTDAFALIAQYPFILTYNGDDFDMPYLYNRARNLGISVDVNPLYMMRDSATLKKGVHIDLYRTLSNRSFQIYAFSHKYTEFSLNSVSKALLGEEKIDYGKTLDDLTYHELAHYCYNDARLTYKLTEFNHNILMNLLVIVSRISRMPIDDIARMGVSQWIRSLLYYEHRKRNAIIPRREELEKKSANVSSEAVIKDKKYRGGLVIEPKAGVYFEVTVMDFASLYPSIIKVSNLSYETVRCPHKECQSNKIPQTNHWTCTMNNGLESLLIGSLRDLRVNYYKNLAKRESLSEEERQQYVVISQALKVILNASYGVMGAEIFPLYFLPAAEATTAIGRHIILETIKKCEVSGINVLYGDTDSIFVEKPTKLQISDIIQSAKKQHGVDLEVDKEYRYVVLSNRKKNYLGVTKKGKVDVKGLTGKKSHTPPFIRTLFYELLNILSVVETLDDFTRAKMQVTWSISKWVKKLEAGEIPLKELAFNVMVSKPISEYVKTIPQHIRAAKLLEDKPVSKKGTIDDYVDIHDEVGVKPKTLSEDLAINKTNDKTTSEYVKTDPQHMRVVKLENKREIQKGDIISFVKTFGGVGVKPVELAKPKDIDTNKYLDFLESTLDQITSSMDLDFDEILGRHKQTGIEDTFY